jgi:hypothetical protein
MRSIDLGLRRDDGKRHCLVVPTRAGIRPKKKKSLLIGFSEISPFRLPLVGSSRDDRILSLILKDKSQYLPHVIPSLTGDPV